MFAGYLNKRSAPISPPPMQRVYSVLWGTMLFDYENEEEAKHSMCPKLVTEILGISEWDGKGRANSYPFGFLLVTHTGGTYYVSVPTIQDRDEWIVQVKRALECVFANSEVLPFKPSKIIQNRPQLQSNMICPKSNHTLSSSVSYCRSCGLGYYSSEYVAEPSTLLQIGLEDQEKVCSDCKNAQLCVLWFKSLNYVHVMTMHDLSPVVQKEISKFKNTFKLTRRLSGRLEMAAELMTNGGISVEEFEELRIVDHAYRRELVFEEATRLKRAVEAFGDDMQTIIGILMNPHLTDKGGRASYYNIILRILEIADNSPDLIDFYFPQIIQVHLQETRVRTIEALVKVDLLQQALLVISQKYPALGLKLAWSLLASVGDFAEKRITQAQYAACMCLLLQLEMAVTGLVSSIADVPTCRVLAKVFRGAAHQQQEIGFEISALFLVRRRLQEMYDEDEADRQARARRLYGGVDEVDGQPVDPNESKTAADASSKRLSSKRSKKGGVTATTTSSSSAGVVKNHETTCKELLYQLGVGQRNTAATAASSTHSEEEFSYVSDVDSDDEPDAESNGILEGATGSRNSHSSAVGSPSAPATLAAQGIIVSDDNSDAGGDDSGKDRLNSSFRHDLDVTVQQWSGFAEQLDFIDRLAEVVDSLRFVDRPMRTEALVKEIGKWNDQPLKYLGWDPTTIAGEPHYRITRIITEECRVFRTKARAPSLIVCEVVRDDLISQGHYANKDEFGLRRSVDRVGSHDNTPLKKTTGGSNVPHERVNQQIDDLVDSNMSQTIAVLHRHQSHEDIHVTSKISKGIDEVKSSIGKLTSAISSNSLTELVLPTNPSPSNSSNSLNSKSTAPSNKKRTPPVMVPRRKTSTFLSSNRLAVGAEDMMRSTVSGSTPSTSVKLSAISLQQRNSFNDLTQFAASGGEGNLSPTVRMSQSGRFKAVSGGNATMEDLDELSESAAQIMLNDDGLSVSSRSTENDTGSVKSGTNSSGTAAVESAQGQVTKKVLTSAQKLLQAGKIDAKEYEQLLACDMQYHEETAREEAHMVKTRVENSLGESWLAKKEKYLGAKMFSHGGSYEESESEEHQWNSDALWPAWDLRCFIVKSNDDLRQEVCCLQLMQLCKEVFDHFGLSNMLWLKPYRIISTSCNTGVVQVLTDAISLDALKKTAGFTNLNNYFKKTYDSSPERLAQAKYNFAASLAAYSLFSYILLIKDRHNGNLLLDVDGHIMHIDFGFLLSIAPGGSFSLESAPFKLTEEMVEVLGGLDSPLFGQFVNAFTKGFIALQANAENIVGALQVLSLNSTFPCFAGKQSSAIIDKLRSRFRTELSVGDAVKHCLDLITNSYGNYGTRQYDTFQYYTNGIFP